MGSCSRVAVISARTVSPLSLSPQLKVASTLAYVAGVEGEGKGKTTAPFLRPATQATSTLKKFATPKVLLYFSIVLSTM